MGDPLIVGGDGRADSRGHSAKYGTYTVMDLPHNCIIDYNVVQSNECGGSYHMEKEGLVRCMKWFKEIDLTIDTLITDRHRSIAKYVRETLHITHLYDIWHMAKGLTKKLEALAREKDCEMLKPWIRSIVNHLYWAATSSKDVQEEERGDMIVAKWLSVINHVQNIHRGHSDLFTRCNHGRLRGRDRNKKWLPRGGHVAIKFEVLAMKTLFLNDIKKLSSVFQTSPLEAYHSLLSHFAPKEIVFTNEGMVCRTALAVMHYNENAGRPQAKTKANIPRYKLRFPKYRHGEAIVQKLLVDPTHEYVSRLMQKTVNICSNRNTVQERGPTPPTLCSQYPRPDMNLLVSQHMSRFNINNS